VLDINEVEQEIARLEGGKTTYANCEKLNVLYSIRDHHTSGRTKMYSYDADPTPVSEFIYAVQNAPFDGVMRIIDEHMNAIETLYPKEYDSIIRKIRNLHDSGG